MTLTVTDQFCGAGGSSLGASAVEGLELKLAMNHWSRAIETHGFNFPDAAHALVDVACVDPRWYSPTDILITSPECKAHSYARGRAKDDPSLFDPNGDMASERSRATMWDVPRFAECHDYKIIIVENVVQAVEWGPKDNKGSQFRAWLMAMDGLGYAHQLVSFNSMFAPPTPQSRDRLYVVFWKKKNRKPNLDFSVPCYCVACEAIVKGEQRFKKLNVHVNEFVGRYGSQYGYVCPTCGALAAPVVTPAASAIDWSLHAQRIGDRKRPLKDATIERIRRGLSRLGEKPMVVAVGGNLFEREGYSRTWATDTPMPTVTTTLDRALVLSNMANGVPKLAEFEPMGTVTTGNKLYLMKVPGGLVVPVKHGKFAESRRARDVGEPLPTMTGQAEYGLALDPAGMVLGQHSHQIAEDANQSAVPTVTTIPGIYLVDLRGKPDRPGGGNQARLPDEPLSTVCASGNHHGLVVANYGPGSTGKGPGGWVRVADEEPIGTITSRDSHSLVVPYRKGTGKSATEPFPTATSVDPYALVEGADVSVEIDDCGFRMLEPHEIARAMVMNRHHDGREYVVSGNKREQVKQYGNAVTPPVMHMILQRCVESLS